jgi:hypothetical protein
MLLVHDSIPTTDPHNIHISTEESALDTAFYLPVGHAEQFKDIIKVLVN